MKTLLFCRGQAGDDDVQCIISDLEEGFSEELVRKEYPGFKLLATRPVDDDFESPLIEIIEKMDALSDEPEPSVILGMLLAKAFVTGFKTYV